MGLVLSELTDAMQDAFRTEWKNAKGTPAPDTGVDDRRMMFAAISRGLLEYLDAHQNDFLTSITFDEGGQPVDHSVTAAELDISTG